MNLYRRIQAIKFRIADRWAHRWSFRIPEEEKEQRRQFAETMNRFAPYFPLQGVMPDFRTDLTLSGADITSGPMILSPNTHVVWPQLNPYEVAAERFMRRRSSAG